MKKLILGLALVAFMTVPAFAATSDKASTNVLLSQYKSKNYLGCIQTSEKILDKNPSNIYAHYYQALAYSQIGKTSKAIEAFEKVVALNSNPVVVKNAMIGAACLKSAEECAKMTESTDEFEAFLKSDKFFDPKVQSEINQKKLDRMRQDINEEVNDIKNEKKSEAPSNEEIANAIKTLAKVGFNPMGNMNMYQSPEMMQMNMLLGDSSSGYNSNNMLPYFLMSQNQNGNMKMSPELMQTMMMSQMNMY